MSEEGDTYVIQAGPEFKVLGKNSLNEMTLATPAISRGSLIIRTASKLYRIAKRTPSAAGQQGTSVFDGESLAEWNVEGTTATAAAGVLTVNDGPGWVRRNGVRANFTLSMDMRLTGRDAKAGVYVRAWPTLDKQTSAPTNGYRVNLRNDAPSPDGISEWERVQIVCNGRTVTVRVNDREVLMRDDVPNPQGFVALTVQGGSAEFRNIELTRPPRSSSPPSQAREGVFRPGGAVQLPRPLKEAKPQYTADAMRAKISGAVLLEAVILADGTVGNVDVVQSLDPLFGLDESAIAAAKQWRFMPGTRGGTPVAVLVTIELTFMLR
jgi:protein TonB